MRFGIVGLGRMGANLARQAVAKGHQVVAHDRDPQALAAASRERIEPASSLADLVAALPSPRCVLLYVPHGPPTERVCRSLCRLLSPGDIVADGGNSHWQDSIRRHDLLGRAGVRFLDVGTSGGVPGARGGACFMVGGDPDAFQALAPLLRDLAVDEEAVFYAGPPGAGHFVKLVHNAIEFGMVQAIAEGVELLMRSGYALDIAALLDSWQHGSVIRGWLVELMAEALRQWDGLERLSSYVEDTGEVKWVLGWALGQDIPTPVTSAAQLALMQYRDQDSAAAKAVAILRHAYGGHPVHLASRPAEPEGREARARGER